MSGQSGQHGKLVDIYMDRINDTKNKKQLCPSVVVIKGVTPFYPMSVCLSV